MTYQDNDTTYEPLEQRKAKALWENRVVQLYTHIFQSGCAIVSAQVRWRQEDGLTDEQYKSEMTNQLRSMFFNFIELHTGKRPNKLG